MLRIIFIISAILLLPIKTIAASDSEAAINSDSNNSSLILNFNRLRSPAGIPFLFMPMPDASKTAVMVGWQVGSDVLDKGYEPAFALGLDLINIAGAGNLTKAELDEKVKDLNMSMTFKDREFTSIITSFYVKPDKLGEVSHLYNLLLTKPNYEQRWLDRIRNNAKLKNTDRSEQADTEAKIWDKILYNDHSLMRHFLFYARDADLEKVNLSHIRQWHNQVFAKDNAIIVIAGNATAKQAGLAIDGMFKNMPEQAKTKNYPPLPMRIKNKTIVYHNPKFKKTTVQVVGLSKKYDVSIKDAAYLKKGVMGVLSLVVLGKSDQNRLDAIRSELQATYGFSGDMVHNIDPIYTDNKFILDIYGAIETAKLKQGMELLKQTYNKFHRYGLSGEEFEYRKKLLLSGLSYSFKQPKDIVDFAYSLADDGYNDNFFKNLNLSEIFNSIQLKSVNQNIREYFPTYDSMLKIIYTPDPGEFKGDCVVTTIKQFDKCLDAD